MHLSARSGSYCDMEIGQATAVSLNGGGFNDCEWFEGIVGTV